MNKIELRTTCALAGVYALRMLGIFLILPIFALYAVHIPGGANHILVGVALGAYGLTQAVFQLPFGMWSDTVGRKKVIYIGLTLLAVGSVICAMAPHIAWVIVGRALQGAGAISAAVMALLADLTREENRTKAMAVVGISIALTFAFSLVLAPPLLEWIGLAGIFSLHGVLAIAAMLVVAKIVPTPTISRFHADTQPHKKRLGPVLADRQLLRLNLGIFILHATQMAMFVALPLMVQPIVGLPTSQHWKIYLPVLLVSFVLMAPMIMWAEKKHRLKTVFVIAVVLLLFAEFGLAYLASTAWILLILLLGYFVGFNVLEAMLPALISKIAPIGAKGTAIGVYNTAQSLGIFVGGTVAGGIFEYFGASAVFAVCALAICIWLGLALTMQAPQPVKTQVLHIGEQWRGDAVVLSAQLAAVVGVKEAVVLMEERIVYLKVAQGWDQASAAILIKETE